MDSEFAHYPADDVRALIEEFPLAWLLPAEGPASAAGLLPLLGDFAADNSLTALIGHMSRRNPLHAAFNANRRAIVLFTGPHGYVSPRHAKKQDWGPTWNFAQVVVECSVEVLPEMTEPAIERLVEVMEPAGADAWRAHELGDRFPAMLGMIIGFRAEVSNVTARFKLGQDETPEVLNAILASHPEPRLVAWMERIHDGRNA